MTTHGFIYITTNTVNGKQYIGQSSYSKRNWRTYLGSGKALKAAIKKYGKDKFKREIIMDGFTMDDLNYLERYFIELHDAVRSENYYNISPGGRASLGFTGKKLSPKHLTAIKEKCQNRVISERMREHMRKVGSTPQTAEHKLKHSNSIKGKNHPKAVSIVVDGIEYETLSAAVKNTQYSFYAIRKMAGLCS